MKKFIKLCICLLLTIGLFGCSEESGVNDLKDVTTGQTNIETGDTQQEINIQLRDQTFPIKVNYKIENRNGWKFTHNSSIDLEIGVLENIEGYDVKVGSVYADVSVVSKRAKYHGLRQDSLFIEYKELASDGIHLEQEIPYSIPFMVEGINQNETFLSIYNGYGYTGSSRVSEEDFVNGLALGARLNVVWTLYITDQTTGDTFAKTISSNIGLNI